MALGICIFLSMCVSVFGVSTERLCADANCKEPISYGSAKFAYVPNEAERVSVKKGDNLTVYSKGAGNDTSLWGVEVHGKRGYVPKAVVFEHRVLHKKLNFIVPTKMESPTVTQLTDSDNLETTSTDIRNSFSVVDGTTIYANTTGEVLETQPIETIVINPQQSVDIQSSKTIDATSISENKLDEPNSSLILPQPTTSSAPVYGASGDEFLGETQTKILEDKKKSSVDTSEPQNKEGAVGVSDAKDFENISGVGEIEENKMPENSEVRQDTISEEEEEAQESQQNEAHDEEAEEEDEEFEAELEDIEQDQDDGRGNEETENEANNDDGHNEKSKDRGKRDLRENTGIDLQDANISEPEIVGNSEENTVALESEQEGINKEPADSGNKETTEGYERHDEPHGVVQTLGDAASVNSFDINVLQHNDFNESQHNYVSGPENSANKDITQNTIVHKKKISSSKTSSKNDVSLELNSNLSEELEEDIGDLTSVNSNTYIGLNTANTEKMQEEKGVGEKDESVFNLLSSFGKFSEVENVKEDTNQATVQNMDATDSSQNNVLQDVTPVVTQNILIEQFPPANPYEEITNPHTTAFPEEHTSVTEQGNDLQQPEGQESVVSTENDEYLNHDTSGSDENIQNDDDDDDDDDSKLEQMDTEETSPEVQGTCEMHSVGCMPESEDFPHQHTSSEEAKSGWFASMFGRASLGSELLLSPPASKEMQKNSFDTFLYLMVTAITVLVFSLGYYYIEKQRRDGSLIAKINSLEKALMVSSQEKYTLKDELESAKEKLSSFIISVDSGETSSVLKDELEDCRNARLELEEQVASLEKELEAATEAGLELNRMMSELLSAQHGSDVLLKSVEHLQKQLDSQQSTISTMTASLSAKNLENENLQSELKLASEHSLNLEEQLAKVNETLMNLQKEKSELEHDFQVKNQSIESQLVEALENKSADSQRLGRELDALQDVLDETRKTLAARDGEVSILRECLTHAECLSNGGEFNISFEEVLNLGHLRGKLDTVTKERDELQEKLQGEEDARKLLEDHMKIVSEEVSTLRLKYEEADRGKMEAQTRLEVLSNYFKEKETQLQKELGLQEAMYIQKEGYALSTIEQIKAYQEEIENYKAQNEILKKEILDQERSMKSQIAVLEKKAHENWVAARQAERRMEESKQEASQLRNRLTMSGRRLVGTIPGPDVIKPSERGTLEVEHNGEMSSLPAHMGETQELPSSPLHFGLPGSPSLLPPGGQPLPPGPFPGMPLFLPPGAPSMSFPILPPPGGLFPDDLRPPPLGRMSSPPPEPRGSFSPFEHSPPISPPSRPYRSTPQYEDSPSRYRHQTPPSSGTPSFSGPFSPGKWDERGDSPRSSFRPLHRDSPREPKGSTLSSGHSSESLDKGSRHSRV